MKRFLSLVLALVMTMSLVTISAGAKEFTDDASINYVEAVDVVSAVGIIDGYTDGSFNPQGGLTRGAAAKIICNLILGPTTADNLIADAAPYADVPTDNVFAGYIAYCQKEGIISGYADGTFKPAASLTGFAFMKMLLGALGYDAKLEGYTGNNWSINVAKQALAIGLEEGLEGTFNGAKALTREEACLYAFNALTATMVEYDETTNIVIGDIQISTTSNEKEVKNVKTSYWDTNIGTNAAQDDTMEFCEKYFGDLKVDATSSAARDGFGRPANYWTLEGKDIGKYAQAYADKEISRGYNTVSALLSSSSYLDYDNADFANNYYLYVNGDGNNSSVNDVTPKGAVIETFKNPQGKVTDVVVYWYDYAKIKDIETDLNTDAKKQGASALIDLVDISDNAIDSYYDAYENADSTHMVLNGYNAKYVKDTVLAVCFSDVDGSVIDSYIPASYTGVPTAAQTPTYKSQNDTFFYEGYATIGGSKYEYAGNLVGLTAGNNVDFTSEYTVYVNNEGYAFAINGKTALNVEDLYMVIGVYEGYNKGSQVFYAQAVSLADGAEKEMILEAGDDIAELNGNTFDTTNAGLYAFTDKADQGNKAKNGKYDTTAYTGLNTGDKYDVDAGYLTADVKANAFRVDYEYTLNNNTVNAKTYLTDKTVAISIESGSAGLVTKYTVGGMQMKKDDGAAQNATATAVIVLEEKLSDEAVLVIYMNDTLKGAVDTEDLVFIAGEPVNAVGTGYAVDLYFMADKSVKNVIVDKNTWSSGEKFYTYAINADGVYELDIATSEELTVGQGEEVAADKLSGWTDNVTVTGVYGKKLTASNFNDVDFSKATVIDSRTEEAREADLYKVEINSAAKLAAAIEKVAKANDTLTVDMFVEDGVITFVNVTVVADAQ